jgi:hypothetical protein
MSALIPPTTTTFNSLGAAMVPAAAGALMQFTDVSKEQYEFSDQVISAASNTSLYP